MNTERDKFLTEAMGECWHEWEGHWTDHKTCLNCGKFNRATNSRFVNTDFSTWVGFGLLWEWAQRQVWWHSMQVKWLPVSGTEYQHFINPDRFADVIYEYLLEADNS